MKKLISLLTLTFVLPLTSFAKTAGPDRIHAPSLPAGTSVPLVVVLHGCETDAQSIENRSQWNLLADEQKFVVLYPNLRNSRNKINCWSWYDPDSQTRLGSENLAVINAIDEVISQYPIDSRRVYISGISAGAGMVANLVSCFPEKFAAAAMHSGMSYGLAQTWQNALKIARNGPGTGALPTLECSPTSFAGGMMTVQGDKDTIMNPKNADRVIADFVLSKISNFTQTTTQFHPALQLMKAPKYAYSVIDYKNNDGTVIGREVMVNGMGHAWSGGAKGSFSDPRGPSATHLMWEFFQGF